MYKILGKVVTLALLVLGFLLGELNLIIQTLMVLILLDFVSGVMKGFYFKTCDSNTSYQGVLKKVSYFIVVALAHWVDLWLGSGDFIRNSTCALFIGTEGLSILENCYAMNKTMPKFLQKTLKRLFEEKDRIRKKINDTKTR